MSIASLIFYMAFNTGFEHMWDLHVTLLQRRIDRARRRKFITAMLRYRRRKARREAK